MATTNVTRKLYEGVADAIAESILAGRYAPGQKLPSERELTESYNVSRPTVREALIALGLRGLVEHRRNAGVYVAAVAPAPGPNTERDLDIGAFELTEARKLFEGEAAALAARCITDAEVEELYALLEEMDRGYERDVMDDMADRRFHFKIAKATRNAAIVHVVETLWDLRYKAALTKEIFRRARLVGISAFADDHRDIVDALRDRNPQAARAAMQGHLTHVMEELLAATETEAVEKVKAEVERQRAEYLQRTRD